MENLKEKIKNIQETTPYKKKFVQTSLFSPLKKEKVMEEDIEKFLNTIKQMNIDKITPFEAMKKLIELKEKLNETKL
jgi:hypothetical protein